MLKLVKALCAAALLGLPGCAADFDAQIADSLITNAPDSGGPPTPVLASTTGVGSFGHPGLPPGVTGPQAVADTDGPYLLDSGDRLRIFVYGQPNLSRSYTVDHDGRITVPLIGHVNARGKTTAQLEGAIRGRLGAQFVRDPQVTVDVLQNRPFFILGEVRNAGQYPYVSGMTVETAVAIAGGYSERASTKRFRLQRRINGLVEVIEAPGDYVVQPGDTVTVFERWF
ncbi:MAG: polysaccharide export protein [Hyphomicrobiaceae bacterium]|nr:polysaccharide export protein [Hyphomicrobiaceae bacterium]